MDPKQDMIDLLARVFNACHCVPAHHCRECQQAARLLELLRDPRVVVAYRGTLELSELNQIGEFVQLSKSID